MGAYFSDKQIDTLDYMGPLPVAPQISYTGDIIETQGKWKEINGVFTARGGEEFIIIGNFKNDKNTRWKELPQFGQYYYAYYHVDNVSVRPIPRGQPARFADSVRYEKYIGKPVELDHIYFEVDKATLLPASYPQLDRLAGYMKKYPRLTIQVSGHTDSTGTASYNLDLSHRRANAVAQYLHEQEIVPKRVSAKGFGYNKPVATNQTEKGRGQNRRVEFLITGW
jgi:outer membrane protein OmpA-like peptidoglycan-associated protein